MEGRLPVADQEVIYKAKYTVEKENDSYRFKYICGLCDWHYTTGLIDADSEDDAMKIAEDEARLYFNGCRKCGRWICDEHYDMDKMVCAECAPTSSSDEIRRNRDNQKKSRPQVLSIVAAVFMVAVVGVGTMIALRGNPGHIILEDENVPLAAPIFIDESAKPFTGALPESMTTDGVKIPIIDSIEIPANTAEVQILLYNPVDNDSDFTFEIIIDGETLYLSGLVEPGMCVEDITLTKGLAQGEYKAILEIRAYAPGDFTQTGSASVEFDLLAEQGGA